MKRHRCPCGATVITGVDDCGLEVDLDTPPLSIIGEALAVLSGRHTWRLSPPNRRHAREIWHRHHLTIGADAGDATLHTSHDCAAPIPAAWLAPEPTPTAAAPSLDEEPTW